jgi:hypothetical protein
VICSVLQLATSVLSSLSAITLRETPIFIPEQLVMWHQMAGDVKLVHSATNMEKFKFRLA